MRTGISVDVSPADRRRLGAIVTDRNSPQKHVWRARIVLLSADGVGTAEIMRTAGVSKTALWRWLMTAIVCMRTSGQVHAWTPAELWLSAMA